MKVDNVTSKIVSKCGKCRIGAGSGSGSGIGIGSYSGSEIVENALDVRTELEQLTIVS